MELLAATGIRLGGALGIFAVLCGLLWDWDKPLLGGVARALARDLRQGRTHDPAASNGAASALLRAALGPGLPFRRFIAKVAGASLCSLVALILVYFMSMPGLTVGFFTDEMSLKLLLRQVAFNGFLIVFLVTWASWAVGARFAGRLAEASAARLALHIVFDILLKLALTVVVTGAVYAAFAHFAGSFGGSVVTALRVIPETLQGAFAFRGLSGAYVYATLLTGFPYFMALLLRISATRPEAGALWRRVARVAPIEDKPFRFLAVLLAGFSAAAGLIASLIFQTLRDVSGW